MVLLDECFFRYIIEEIILWKRSRLRLSVLVAMEAVGLSSFYSIIRKPKLGSSSTNRISGSKWAATANARRTYMPLE